MIRQFSAGGVVYKIHQDQVLFLLRKGSVNPDYKGSTDWSLPKGWLDDAGPEMPGPYTLGHKRATADQIQAAALREVAEETGVNAQIVSRLGSVQFFFVDSRHQKVFKTVIYFLMRYMSDLPAGFGYETSQITWVSAVDAKELLKNRKGEYDLIIKAIPLCEKS